MDVIEVLTPRSGGRGDRVVYVNGERLPYQSSFTQVTPLLQQVVEEHYGIVVGYTNSAERVISFRRLGEALGEIGCLLTEHTGFVGDNNYLHRMWLVHHPDEIIDGVSSQVRQGERPMDNYLQSPDYDIEVELDRVFGKVVRPYQMSVPPLWLPASRIDIWRHDPDPTPVKGRRKRKEVIVSVNRGQLPKDYAGWTNDEILRMIVGMKIEIYHSVRDSLRQEGWDLVQMKGDTLATADHHLWFLVETNEFSLSNVDHKVLAQLDCATWDMLGDLMQYHQNGVGVSVPILDYYALEPLEKLGVTLTDTNIILDDQLYNWYKQIDNVIGKRVRDEY